VGLTRPFAGDSSVTVCGESRTTVRDLASLGGRGGIRTPETGFARLTVFKTVAFNRSATLPRLVQILRARTAPPARV
jgi:hypothetical protein